MLTTIGAWMKKSIGILFSVMLAAILLLLLFFSDKSYYCKKVFLLPNGALLLIALGLAVLFSCILVRCYQAVEHGLSRHFRWLFPTLAVLLLLLQFAVCYYAYFFTGWDVNMVISQAFQIARGDYSGLEHAYFSRYPNNIFLLWLFSVIFKICFALDITYKSSCVLILLFSQSVLSTLAACLLQRICFAYTNSHVISWCVWLFYAFFVGLSPWLLIPYSDSFGLIFPVLLLWIYHWQKNGRLLWLKWILLGALSFIGYKIKPQVVIMTIAILIVESIHILTNIKEKGTLNKAFVKMASALAAAGVCFMIFSQVILPSVPVKIDPERAFSMTHFMMMGLNRETNGVYSYEDVVYSDSFSDYSERQKGNAAVIKQRVQDYGAHNLLKHLGKKCLVNYGDGTFAWGKEGRFYLQTFPDKDAVLSPLLKQILYTGGKYHPLYSSLLQAAWLLLLFSALGCAAFIFRKNVSDELWTAMLAIIGLTLFVLLFEARARYLYTYAPIYILLGAIGWKQMVSAVRTLFAKAKQNRRKTAGCAFSEVLSLR